MSLPNIAGTIIASGYNCVIRIGTSASDCAPVALVASFQATEDFQTQEATVIGHLGPVSLDPQGYSCSITLDGFLPAKGAINDGAQYGTADDNGTKAITNHIQNATREKFMEAGVMSKIAYLDFYNRKSGTILAAFEGVILSSYGVNVEGSAYVRNNVQLRALAMTTK